MADLVGRALDRYKIVELVGKGGMATVYRARQPRLQRDVAVKVMLPSLSTNPVFCQRFEREAQSIANLRHPNILSVYDYGETDDGHAYLVVDYVRGGTLRDRLEEGLSLEEAVEIVAQVAEALDCAHRHGAVHRDVKPNNILLTQDGRPLLADFGLVKPIREGRNLTDPGTVVGTPEYVSPEQARGLDVDSRTDIYALGVVLFESVTGQHPFLGETPMDILFKHISEPLPRPSQVNPRIPPALDDVVTRATAKSPGERFQRASQMAQALRVALASDETAASIPAQPSPPSLAACSPAPPTVEVEPRSRPWYRSKIAGGIGAVAVAVVILAAILASPSWVSGSSGTSSTLNCVYFSLLAAGAVWTAAALVGGAADDIDLPGVDLPGGFDLDHGEVDVGPLSPVTIASFGASFGGLGIVATQLLRISDVASIMFAALGAGLIATGMFLFYSRVLIAGQGSSEARLVDVRAKSGEVIVSIPEGGVGRVALVIRGSRSTWSARSVDGQAIPRGALVTVRSVVGNTIIVDRREEG